MLARRLLAIALTLAAIVQAAPASAATKPFSMVVAPASVAGGGPSTF